MADRLTQKVTSINHWPAACLVLDDLDELSRLVERHNRTIARLPIKRYEFVVLRLRVTQEVLNLIGHTEAPDEKGRHP